MVLESERLIIRKMDYDDYDALYTVLADSDIMEHYPYTRVYVINRKEWEEQHET